MEDAPKNEILQAIDKIEGRFDGLETRFDGLETRFDGLETRFDGLETRFDGLETRFDGLEKKLEKTEGDLMEAIHDLADDVQAINDRLDRHETGIKYLKSQMVTKDHLDRKIDDLRGELVALSRKVNTKLSILVEQLVMDGTLKRQVADKILALEPFPVA